MKAATHGPITIKQLAQMLGMAHSTVSRALNGHPSISEKTRKLILDLATREGYIPNSAARSLKTARSHIVGLVVPDIENRYYTTIAKTIADAAASQSWQMMLATTDDRSDREQVAILNLLEAQAEGVVLVPTPEPTPETFAMLKRLDVVQLLRQHHDLAAPFVSVADHEGIAAAAQHLVQLGHKRIGYIGSHTVISTGASRLRGLLSVLGDTPDTRRLVRLCTPRTEAAESAFLELMRGEDHPTGIILGGTRYTAGVLAGAAKLNLRIPSDFSLVGYGDGDLVPFLANGLTTLALPEQEMADACSSLLGLATSGKREHNHKQVILCQPSLVIRHSTSSPKAS